MARARGVSVRMPEWHLLKQSLLVASFHPPDQIIQCTHEALAVVIETSKATTLEDLVEAA